MKKIPDERLYKEVFIKFIDDIIQDQDETSLDDFIKKIEDLKLCKTDCINLYIKVERDYDYTTFSLMGFQRKTQEEIEKYDKKQDEIKKKKAVQKQIKKAKLLKELSDLEKEE